jgi:hypothetical protein
MKYRFINVEMLNMNPRYMKSYKVGASVHILQMFKLAEDNEDAENVSKDEAGRNPRGHFFICENIYTNIETTRKNGENH